MGASTAGPVSWFITKDQDMETRSMGAKYMYAVYWAVTTITTTGFGDITATTSTEMVFVIFVLLLAAVTNAAIIGSISVFAEYQTQHTTRFKMITQVTSTFLQNRGVSHRLRQRVQHYQFAVNHQETVLNDRTMPFPYRDKVCEFLYSPVIRNFACLLKGEAMTKSLFAFMCTKLKPDVCLAGDIVIKAGDIGDRMYFIVGGTAQIILPNNHNGGLIVCSDHDYFGEVSMIIPQSTRTATVLSLSQLEMLTLSRKDWYDLLEQYSALAEQLVMSILTKCQENYADLFDYLAVARPHMLHMLNKRKTVQAPDLVQAAHASSSRMSRSQEDTLTIHR